MRFCSLQFHSLLGADEMLAIRSEIDAWREKKDSEEANARHNEITTEPGDETVDF